ncbi:MULTISPECIES: chemotaxis protein CheW [unclassified Leptolyngbya]|uniref:chemotaxis protein CheW n=1 Tax=unclassified Leptolyngbya TaxID=2650499 RepID=UPI00168228AA|nr:MULTISPECIES: chemotaxis protein CheW [unclassified Leptolyngbya]MBD1911101.1 chemotaxis protein CheW [Leptolyngbya sp. FACHB-8]MBD2157083.1 chemotaxis protein CheW [Leptolyngbya sp. FACHB-16]
MQVNTAAQATSKTALLLLFHIEENLYAIDTSNVIEIAPVVLLRKIEAASEYIAGVFNYHNTIVPVIDLCQLIRGTSCKISYSTRLIMVNYGANSCQGEHSPYQKRQLGLLAERVTETLKVPINTLKNAENMSDSSVMGELFIDGKGIIQKVNWEQLVADGLDPALFTERSGQVNGAGCN